MSGSKTYFGYIADDNSKYFTQLDRSNSNGRMIIIDSGNIAEYKPLPRSVKMRHVVVQCNANPHIIRKLYCGSQALLSSLLASTGVTLQRYPDMEAEAFTILYARGERSPRPKKTNPDTYLTDPTTDP